MKTIGELLVETTTQLWMVARDEPFSWSRNEAVRIVTEFYGPPCDDPFQYQRANGVSDNLVFDDSSMKPLPSDACVNCGWPRGEHQ